MSELPSPPFIKVDGIQNFRDIGGYQIADSTDRKVRNGLLHRSADPYRVSALGKGTIAFLEIRTIFDLRSKPEVARAVLGTIDNLASVPGLEYRFTPVFPDQDSSPEALALRYEAYAQGGVEGFTRAYRDILESGHVAYREVFLHLRDRPNDAILFHCSAGKDRTGVLAALILRLAGVDDETIAQEYEYTEIGLGPLKEIMINHLLETPSLKGSRATALRMVGSKYEAMIATLQILDKDYGGVEGYLTKRCGFTANDLSIIRKNLIAE